VLVKQPAPAPGPQPKPETPEVDPQLKEILRQADDLMRQASMDDRAVRAHLNRSPFPERMQSLLRQRHEAAREEFRCRLQQFLSGRGTLDILLGSSQRLLQAEQELNVGQPVQVEATRNQLQRLETIEKVVKATFDAGRAAQGDYAQVLSLRFQAEVELERMRGK
jgi:hypothetical protein